jgi:hypothetical protein
MVLVYAKRKAANAATIKGNKTRKNAGVEVLQQKFDGTLVVPSQPLPPDTAFFLQQWTQLASGKMPQIKDFELGRNSHAGQGLLLSL